MYEDARDQLQRDVSNVDLSPNMRDLAGLTLQTLDRYIAMRYPEARKPTNPSGTSLVKPKPA